MKKCLVIGAAMLDIVMQIDELPKKGEDVYAKSQTMTVGGCAYNVAGYHEAFCSAIYIVCTDRNRNVCFHDP